MLPIRMTLNRNFKTQYYGLKWNLETSLYGEDLQLFSRTDSMPLPNRNQYPNQFISLEMSDKEEIDRIFSELSEGGTIVFPLSKTFFSESYGRVVVKYGVGWELMV